MHRALFTLFRAGCFTLAGLPLLCAQNAGSASDPRLISSPPPVLPTSASAQGLTGGKVQVAAAVAPSGTVSDCLVTASTDRALDAVVLAAVRQWRFDPRTVGPWEDHPVMDLDVPVGAQAAQGDAGGENWAYQLPELKELDHSPTPVRIVRPAFSGNEVAKALKAGTDEIAVTFYIDEQGRVRLPSIAASATPALDEAAIAALSQWQFEPPLLHQHPTAVRSEQTFRFGPPRRQDPSLRAPTLISEIQMPGPRFGSAAVTDGSAIYIISGQAGGRAPYFVPEILRYDLATHAFAVLAKNKIFGTIFAGAAIVDRKIYIIGGRGITGNTWAHIQIYDLATGAVTLGPTMPRPRANFAIGAIGRKIYCIGGSVYLDDAIDEDFVLNVDTGIWSKIAPMPARGFARGAVLDNGRIFVGGGRYDSLHTRFIRRMARVYVPETNSWRIRRGLTSPMSPSSIVKVGTHLYAVGGYEGVIIYNLLTGRSARFPLPGNNSYASVSVAVGPNLYVIGGTLEPRHGLTSNKISVYQTAP